MRFDPLDAEILRLLTKDPRNISAIARRLGLPAETVRYRVRRLLSNRFIRVFAVPNYAKLGLSLMWLFVEARHNEALEVLLDNHPYVSYLSKCYGWVKGYLVNLLAPRSMEEEALRYLEWLKGGGYLKDYVALTTLPMEYPLPDFSKYYDYGEGVWRYSWDPLSRCSRNPVKANVSIPKEAYLDEVDIAIIRKLQVNATLSLTELADKLGLNVVSLRYHFINHVLGKGLIKYAVEYSPYPGVPPAVLVIRLTDKVQIGNLMEALRGLPPVIGLAPGYDSSVLLLLLQAPLNSLLELYKALKELMDKGLVEEYTEVFIDLSYVRKYTIPEPKYYKAGRWSPEPLRVEARKAETT